MAEREAEVLFRVTRPNTSVFHPDRSVSLVPAMTGEEIKLPKSVAEYHVKNGVGEIVEPEAPAEDPKTEDPKTPVKRGPGRPAAAK